jgi:hypothetical protein
MKRTKTPAVKRTRRHVVIRFTPDEAHAAFWLAMTADEDKLPPHCRKARNRVREKLEAAYLAAQTEPTARPNRTSIGQASGMPPADINGYPQGS